ncbi:MAG: MFS transporter [Paracoccaceae bacterium]
MVFALWAAGLGAAAQYGKMSVAYENLGEIYPQAGAALGLVVSLVGLVGIVLGVTAGLLVARIRYRRALLWALFVGAGLSAYQASLPPIGLMLLSRALEGASHLAIVVAAPTLIAQISAPQHRGFTLTLWGSFFGVAFAFLTWAGLPLVAAYGLSALFLAHSAYMAAIAVLLWLTLAKLNAPGPSGNLSLGQIIREHVLIYRSPFVSAPALGWLFYAFCFVSLLTLLPQFLAPEVRAFVIGAMPLVSIASSMTFGVCLLRSWSAVRVIQLGFSLSLLACLFLLVFPGVPGLCLCLAASLGLVQGATFAAVPQLNTTADDQARANGALAQMGNIGNTLGTPVIATLILSFGYSGMIWAVALIFAAGATTHFLLARRRLSVDI